MLNTQQKEARRCLKCPEPSCKPHCPLLTDIPNLTPLVEDGEFEKAGEILFLNNPLSAVTSIVCPHDQNCYGHCKQSFMGQGIKFYEIEQFISNLYLETYQPEMPPPNGHKIAVIGAGPGGITMSILLALKGYAITLFEAQDKIGGILQYGIPDFRLPKEVLQKYHNILDRLGTMFRFNTYIGSTVTVGDMLMDGYSAVFIAVGTPRPNKFGLLGETLGNVHYAVDYLKSPDAFKFGKQVAIVGAGNVAMDVARTMLRHSQECDVTIINNLREEDMAASKYESDMAKVDGVKFIHERQPMRLTADGVDCCGIKYDEGKYSEDISTKEKIPADTIVLAIGQGPLAAALIGTRITQTKSGLYEADENGRTNHPGIFAAGDVVSGPKSVSEAVAFSKRTAAAIDEYCQNKV